jgi:hypothetical protein
VTHDEPSPAQECAAFPILLRAACVVLLMLLAASTLGALPQLRQAQWSGPSLAFFGTVAVCVLWFGYWMLASRTRLDSELLTQTWLWNKQVRAGDVSHMKLVHWRRVDWLVAPRLLVRQRNGAITWFHAADGRLLRDFAGRVALRLAAAGS